MPAEIWHSLTYPYLPFVLRQLGLAYKPFFEALVGDKVDIGKRDKQDSLSNDYWGHTYWIKNLQFHPTERPWKFYASISVTPYPGCCGISVLNGIWVNGAGPYDYPLLKVDIAKKWLALLYKMGWDIAQQRHNTAQVQATHVREPHFEIFTEMGMKEISHFPNRNTQNMIRVFAGLGTKNDSFFAKLSEEAQALELSKPAVPEPPPPSGEEKSS